MEIQVLGSDVDGRSYAEGAQTLEVSRNGALIVISRSLTPQEEILIHRAQSRKESPAQVVGQVRKQIEGLVYGVRLLDNNINLWDIDFVPLAGTESPVARMLLECAKCSGREVIHLEEFETEVYFANRYIYHDCKRCRESTIWREAEYEAAERRPKAEAAPPPPRAEAALEPRTRNERRHNRINCQLRACIRYKQHYEDEILDVTDVSRGGVSFPTHKYLAPGTKFEIAIPYSHGMANIYILAQVVRLKPIPERNMYDCGAAYIKP